MLNKKVQENIIDSTQENTIDSTSGQIDSSSDQIDSTTDTDQSVKSSEVIEKIKNILKEHKNSSLIAKYCNLISKNARISTCGKCESCTRSDCGLCRPCLNMKKFGGRGTQKQKCFLKICPIQKAIKQVLSSAKTGKQESLNSETIQESTHTEKELGKQLKNKR